jgi:hypothetical protein
MLKAILHGVPGIARELCILPASTTSVRRIHGSVLATLHDLTCFAQPRSALSLNAVGAVVSITDSSTLVHRGSTLYPAGKQAGRQAGMLQLR